MLLMSAAVKAGFEGSNATEWLGSIDNGIYENSWNNASPYLKSQVSEDKWVSMVKSVREPLGTLLYRKVVSSEAYKDLPNAPKGHYQVIIYNSEFEHKNNATETVTFMKVGNQWQAAGYFIK